MSKINTVVSHKAIVWINLGDHIDSVTTGVTLAELEAYCASVRKAGAGDDQYISLSRELNVRLSATVSLPLPAKES